MKILFLIGHLVKERDLILYELAESLSMQGADVVAISGFPSRRLNTDIVEYYKNHPIEVISNNFTSIHVGSKKGEGNSLFSRMIKYVFLTRAIYNETKRHEADIIYIYSTPPFLGYLAKKLKKKAPVIYNAQDLFPDSLKTALKISEKNPLMHFLRRREQLVYSNSSKIVTISQDMRDYIVSLGADASKVEVINNWADTEQIKPVPREENKIFDEFGIDRNKFIVLYAGDIGLHQKLSAFIDAAKILKDDRSVDFVFFGNGAYKADMESLIKEFQLDNVKVFPLQPVEKISMVYSAGDIDIVSLEDGMTRLALPSKVWSVMASGRPILASVDSKSELAGCIRENKGFVLEEGTGEEIARLILNLKNKKDMLANMGTEARKFVKVNNNRNIQTAKYLDVFTEEISKQMRKL